ncbi:hypothetical protein F5X68DRAFT_17683 [Plectosphaerella plurivora]|uniref:Uncharacterized protein n=1 Tax=Plectosphaerella plurivora TaxID=936078 RepID=A0A9P9AA51_9PEZI|nr:hypothetical protein F5X68DRAFT_17683 [Plectosphaerella plurivora]
MSRQGGIRRVDQRSVRCACGGSMAQVERDTLQNPNHHPSESRTTPSSISSPETQTPGAKPLQVPRLDLFESVVRFGGHGGGTDIGSSCSQPHHPFSRPSHKLSFLRFISANSNDYARSGNKTHSSIPSTARLSVEVCWTTCTGPQVNRRTPIRPSAEKQKPSNLYPSRVQSSSLGPLLPSLIRSQRSAPLHPPPPALWPLAPLPL